MPKFIFKQRIFKQPNFTQVELPQGRSSASRYLVTSKRGTPNCNAEGNAETATAIIPGLQVQLPMHGHGWFCYGKAYPGRALPVVS